MEKEENCAGGETILLDERDDLTSVPASHQHLLTPALREAFIDPPAYFSGLAKRCPFPQYG